MKFRDVVRQWVKPNEDRRVEGTTYPTGHAPPYAAEIIERGVQAIELAKGLIMRASVRVVRPKQGDVLIVRTDRPPSIQAVANINEVLRNSGHGVVVFLPKDCSVHAEPARLKNEDRGYRETKTYGADKDKPAENQDRGVYVGLPGEEAPDPCS